MDAKETMTGHSVQHDPSGVGHAWQPLNAESEYDGIMEEIAAWIIEDGPEPGAEMTASNGQHYRLPPEA